MFIASMILKETDLRYASQFGAEGCQGRMYDRPYVFMEGRFYFIFRNVEICVR